MMIAQILALTGLLILPLTAVAHPGTTHQHSSTELGLVIGMVLLVAVVVGVLSQGKSFSESDEKE